MAGTVAIPDGHPWDDGRWAADRLQGAGFQAWFVGGCVRDLLLGRPVHDVDIATDAHPEQVERCFDRSIAVGKAFGVVIALTAAGRQVEVATFRADGVYIDGRRPTGVVFTTAVDDVRRRDFTINALLLDPRSGEVTDPVGGLPDLAARLLRVVGGPARLAEDRLRVLRGLRFAAHLGLAIEPETWAALRTTTLEGLSRERIWQEIGKALASAGRGQWYELVCATGKLSALCPLLAPAPETTARLDRVQPDDDPLLAEALLFAPASDPGLRDWLASEPVPRQRIQRLRVLRAGAERLRAGCSISERRRLLRAPDGALLVRYLQCRQEVEEASAWLREELASGPLPVLARAGDLLAAGLPAGPAIGRALRLIEDAQLAGEIATAAEALALARAASGH